MEKIKVYAELIELKAKVASVLPFLFGIEYGLYNLTQVKPGATFRLLVFITALLLINSAVDCLNNYCDYIGAKSHNYKEKTNIIGREGLSAKAVLTGTIVMVLGALILGIYLVYETDVMLLWIGLYSFCVGIFYSAGPLPLSHIPLGEFFSGTTMGFLIPLCTVGIYWGSFSGWSWQQVVALLISSMPLVFAIGSLMLVNNLCDIEEDLANGRRTLPGLIGRENSLKLLAIFYMGIYVFQITSVFLGYLPLFTLLSLLSGIVVFKGFKEIRKEPVKRAAFPFAVKNLAIVSVAQVVTFGLALLIN